MSATPLEQLVRRAIDRLMQADANARGVTTFDPQVHDFSLPDVLQALSKSALASGDAAAAAVVADVARESRAW